MGGRVVSATAFLAPGVVAATLALVVPAARAEADARAPIDGVWKTEPRESGAYITVRIGPCRDGAETRCGTIEGAHAGARPDIVGDRILRGLEPTAEGEWTGGTIIRPGEGTEYRSRVTLTGDARLEVEGCVIGGLICRGQTWRRVR